MDIRKFFKGGGGAKKAAVKEEGVKRKQPVASAQSAAQKKPKQGATADAGRAAAKAADGTDDGNVVWKWINHTQPKSFDRALFPKLNAGWGGWKAGGSQTMSLTITQGAKKVSYTIDFEAMKQVNDETGYERTIKRVVSQPKPKSEPPRKQACSSDLDTFRAQGAASAAAASSGKAATKKASPSSKGKQGKAKIGVTTYTAEKKQPAQPKAKRASGGGGGGGGGAPWMSGPPPMLGMKNIPEGKPGCLKGKTFLVTGVLESLGRDDAFDLIRKYGGEVLKSVTKKKVLVTRPPDARPPVPLQPDAAVCPAHRAPHSLVPREEVSELTGDARGRCSTTPSSARARARRSSRRWTRPSTTSSAWTRTGCST
jgi:replication factor C subunit 1